jgi:hypothetical protein
MNSIDTHCDNSQKIACGPIKKKENFNCMYKKPFNFIF